MHQGKYAWKPVQATCKECSKCTESWLGACGRCIEGIAKCCDRCACLLPVDLFAACACAPHTRPGAHTPCAADVLAAPPQMLHFMLRVLQKLQCYTA